VISMHATEGRHLYRDRDRAVLGGVCAGLANFLGFNLRVTRILAFIAFLMVMPVAVIGYLAAVFLIPSVSNGDIDGSVETRVRQRSTGSRRTRRKDRKARKNQETVDSIKSTVAADINRRCQSMDERLAELEKHVTSKRFQLDQELSRL
jgi:phage shock protein C